MWFGTGGLLTGGCGIAGAGSGRACAGASRGDVQCCVFLEWASSNPAEVAGKIFVFFWPRLIFSQGGIGKKRSYSSNLIALLVVATRIERRYWFLFRRGEKIPGRNSVGEFFCLWMMWTQTRGVGVGAKALGWEIEACLTWLSKKRVPSWKMVTSRAKGLITFNLSGVKQRSSGSLVA